MKKQIVVVSLVAMCLCGVNGCDVSQAVEFNDTNTFLTDINDIKYEEPVIEKVISKSLKQTKKNETIIEETSEETVIPIEESSTIVEEDVLIEELVIGEEDILIEEEPGPQNDINAEGLTQQSGVNYHDGRTETYYSSEVLYHQDTDNWTVDDEGFYRTDEGYYVVAASDMEQGTIFEGSKGTCIVLDSGCAEGTTDYYVNW